MLSKIIFRSCGSSIRALINRHIRPTAASMESIYNWHYLLPNSFVPQPVNIGYRFGRDVAGYSVLGEVAGGRRNFAAANSNFDDENEYDDDADDDDFEDDVFEYQATDDESDSEDDDHSRTDDD